MGDIDERAWKRRARGRDQFVPFRPVRGLGQFGADRKDVGAFFGGDPGDAIELAPILREPGLPVLLGAELDRAGPAFRNPDMRLHHDRKPQRRTWRIASRSASSRMSIPRVSSGLDGVRCHRNGTTATVRAPIRRAATSACSAEALPKG